MMNQRAYISGPKFNDTPGRLIIEPQVGDPMQLFLDDGRVLRTSAVTNVSRNGSELVVDTQNSHYRVKVVASA